MQEKNRKRQTCEKDKSGGRVTCCKGSLDVGTLMTDLMKEWGEVHVFLRDGTPSSFYRLRLHKL